jgi:hypothetical protein
MNKIEYLIVDTKDREYYSLDPDYFVTNIYKAFVFPTEELAELILDQWLLAFNISFRKVVQADYEVIPICVSGLKYDDY